jgi:hypothetical protein
LDGAVVTADAMFTHADVCAAVRDRGGEYTGYAKGNQAELLEAPAETFVAAAGGAFPPTSSASGTRRCGW